MLVTAADLREVTISMLRAEYWPVRNLYYRGWNSNMDKIVRHFRVEIVDSLAARTAVILKDDLQITTATSSTDSLPLRV